jgi:hypothetical protein
VKYGTETDHNHTYKYGMKYYLQVNNHKHGAGGKFGVMSHKFTVHKIVLTLFCNNNNNNNDKFVFTITGSKKSESTRIRPYDPLLMRYNSRYCWIINLRYLNILLTIQDLWESRDSSVGIALVYGLDDRGSRIRFPAGAGNFSLHYRIQNGSGAYPTSYPMGTRGSFPGGKAAGE